MKNLQSTANIRIDGTEGADVRHFYMFLAAVGGGISTYYISENLEDFNRIPAKGEEMTRVLKWARDGILCPDINAFIGWSKDFCLCVAKGAIWTQDQSVVVKLGLTDIVRHNLNHPETAKRDVANTSLQDLLTFQRSEQEKYGGLMSLETLCVKDEYTQMWRDIQKDQVKTTHQERAVRQP